MRPQLVAFHPSQERALVHPLDAIDPVELLESGFERQMAIDVRRFAANAFVPFEEGPVEIAWRFVGDADDDALEYPFHPGQQIAQREDGAVEVRFRAESLVQMAWHLFAWGDRTRALEPLLVKDRFHAMVRRALAALPAAGAALAVEARLED